MATKLIQAKVRRAGLSDILGEQGAVNVQGEVQQKLDVYSNEVLAHCLSVRESIGVLASEENERPILVHKGSEKANYAVVFDPLDGFVQHRRQRQCGNDLFYSASPEERGTR